MSRKWKTKDDRWRVILDDNKEFSYSEKRYGKYAEMMADYSLKYGKKLNNWFEHLDNGKTIIYVPYKGGNSIEKCYIDTEDYDLIKDYHWSAYKTKNELYAECHKDGHRTYMHRLIMNTPLDLIVDHKNGNGLNNCKENLKNVTIAQNTSNRIHAQNNNTFNINGLKYTNNKQDIQATWVDGNGKRRTKTFRIEKYGGLNETLKIAKEYRDSKMNESSNYIKNEGSFHNE